MLNPGLTMKRNSYIALTVICILAIIFIQNFAVPARPAKETTPLFNPERIIDGPGRNALFTLGSFYLFLVLTGLVNLVIFGLKKYQKKPLITIKKIRYQFDLSEGAAAKVLLLITFLILVMYILPLTLKNYPHLFSANFLLGLHAVLLIAEGCLILKYINLKSLGVNAGRKYTFLALRIYTTLLPLILIALVLNSLLLKKVGIASPHNPAVELFILLKSKLSLSLLGIQIILLAPIVEELFFRGFFYRLARREYGFGQSAVLVSLVFSLMHRTPQAILPLFVISLGLCYLYEKTQNIFSAIVFHAFHNTLSLLFLIVIKNLH